MASAGCGCAEPPAHRGSEDEILRHQTPDTNTRLGPQRKGARNENDTNPGGMTMTLCFQSRISSENNFARRNHQHPLATNLGVVYESVTRNGQPGSAVAEGLGSPGLGVSVCSCRSVRPGSRRSNSGGAISPRPLVSGLWRRSTRHCALMT